MHTKKDEKIKSGRTLFSMNFVWHRWRPKGASACARRAQALELKPGKNPRYLGAPFSLKGKAGGWTGNAKKALSTWEGPTSLKEKAGVRVDQPVDASKFEKNVRKTSGNCHDTSVCCLGGVLELFPIFHF